jgi:prophage antirepressor-like protein
VNQTTSLIDFQFQDRPVRIVEKDGEPWFVAKDVAEALEYVWEGSKSIRHVPEEWRGVYSVYTPYEEWKRVSSVLTPGGNSELPPSEEWKGSNPIATPGGNQNMLCLSEPGLYFFLGRSDKPLALPFQKWMAGEVIPSIRKKGFYAVPGRDREEQDEWKRNFPYPFLLLDDAAVKMREMRLDVDKGLLTPREWRRVVLGASGPAKPEDTAVTGFVKEYLVITGNERDFVTAADLYTFYRLTAESPYSRNVMVRKIKDTFPALVYKQKKIDGYPVLVFSGCKLKSRKPGVTALAAEALKDERGRP